MKPATQVLFDTLLCENYKRFPQLQWQWNKIHGQMLLVIFLNEFMDLF